jgi:uncharacterized membrane protein
VAEGAGEVVIAADTAGVVAEVVAADAVATGVADAAAIAVVTADATARFSSVDSLQNSRAQKIGAHRTGADECI